MIAWIFFAGAILALLCALAAALLAQYRTGAVLLAQAVIFMAIGLGLRWHDWVMTAVPAAALAIGMLAAYRIGKRPGAELPENGA